jgi:acyl-CoA thioesterase-1
MPTSTIDDNLGSIITRAKQRNIRVLLCGMETPPTHGLDYSVAFHFVFPTVAQRLAVPLVPFVLAGVALDPELNGADGVHPNAAGAERIADTVWTYLRPLLSWPVPDQCTSDPPRRHEDTKTHIDLRDFVLRG